MQLPVDFLSVIQPLLCDETENFITALSTETPVSIRLNPLKNNRNPLQLSVENERVKWSDTGYYLENRPAFTFDPLFHAGHYYVQEAASMFVEQVIKQLIDKPVCVLDLCAAPGGKSVTLLSALPEGSLLVSNEIVRPRANVLAETMAKFGNPDSIVTNNAPKDFAHFPNLFDVVLVDAPCSGEGMFRKDKVAVQEWSLANVQMCTARQQEILQDVWAALKPGGWLIYSTCTYNLSENEENARWISHELGAEFVSLKTEVEWGISSAFDGKTVCYRFFPHKTKGEGLFVTVLQKNSLAEDEFARPSTKNKKKASPFLKDVSPFSHFLNHPEKFDFVEEHNHIIALPQEHSETFLLLREKLKVIAAGIEIGERKGKDFIPAHALAMSTELNFDAFSKCELSYEQAIAYLRKEAITLTDAPKGFVLLTYKNEPMGFVKNLGNRANNLYPNEWRIRSGYLPENRPDVLVSKV